MTFYLVKATPKSNIAELRYDIDNGMIRALVPFGKSLQYSSENARLDNDKYAVWIEEDYCSPPLPMEREAVLDRFFDDIKVDVVYSEEDGWSKIRDRQPFWTILNKLHDEMLEIHFSERNFRNTRNKLVEIQLQFDMIV